MTGSDAREPAPDLVGEGGDWRLEDPDRIAIASGDLISFASSRRPGEHTHDPNRMPRAGVKCQACRWFEIIIVEGDGRYVMQRRMRSSVRGETTRFLPLVVADNAQDLIDALWETDQAGHVFMSRVAQTALTEAAEFDDRIEQILQGATKRVEHI